MASGLEAAVMRGCSGVTRWRALGQAAHFLCPLHTRHHPPPHPHLASRRHRHPSLLPTPLHPRSSNPTLIPSATPASTPALLAAISHAASSPAALPALASLTSASAAPLPPAVAALAALLPSIGIFMLCAAAAVLLIASVPAVLAAARAAHRAERLMAALESELPDTVAAMRLSGLEVTDAIQELGALGGELSRGVRSTAALASLAEAGVRGGLAAAEGAVKGAVVPALREAESGARGAAEAHLAATAKLSYTRPVVQQVAATASGVATAARRLRAGIALGHLAGAAVQAGRSANEFLRRSAQPDDPPPQPTHGSATTAGFPPKRPSPAAERLADEEAALRAQLDRLEAAARQQRQQRQQPAQKQPRQQQQPGGVSSASGAGGAAPSRPGGAAQPGPPPRAPPPRPVGPGTPESNGASPRL